MAKFNRERAKAELGWSDAQIDEYLSSSQGRLDSTAVASAPSAGGGTDPLGMVGGMVSSAVDAVGGPKVIAGAGGLGVGGLIGRHVLKNMRRSAAPAPAAGPPPGPPPSGPPNVSRATSAPRVSASLHTLTEDDVKNVPAFKNAKPGEVVRRSFYEKERFATPAPPKRTTAKIVPLPKRRTIKPPDTVPIRVQDKPEAVRGTKQRGVSRREIASRQKGMAESRTTRPAADASDLEQQLAKSLEAEAAMTKLNVPRAMRGTLRRGLRGGGTMASLLMTLLDAQSMPEQMDDAGREVRRAIDPRLLEMLGGDDYFEDARRTY